MSQTLTRLIQPPAVEMTVYHNVRLTVQDHTKKSSHYSFLSFSSPPVYAHLSLLECATSLSLKRLPDNRIPLARRMQPS